MKENMLASRGLVFSQRVMLKLAEKGLSREAAYKVVQRNAMKVWDDKLQFRDLLEDDKDVTKTLNKKDLDACFDMAPYIKNVGYIFKRVFGR
jgi:adenylosuccinate lyase